MKRGQNGFGAIEALLFLILISILGFTGYYVYHTKNNTDSIYNNTTQTSNSTKAVSKSNTFVFKELGVQIELNDKLKGLTYYISPETGRTIISTDEFSAAYKKCSPDSTSKPDFAGIFKKSGQYSLDDGVDLLKQFNGYYIGWLPNSVNIICTDPANDQPTNQVATDTNHAVKEAFKTATEVK